MPGVWRSRPLRPRRRGGFVRSGSETPVSEVGSGVLKLSVAAVALALLGLGLGVLAAVGGQRLADVDAFLELPFFVAAHVALVGPGIDQLAFGRHVSLLRWTHR